MRFLSSLAALIAAGCFSPSERDGAVACGEEGVCPPGYQCYVGDMRCYRELPDEVNDASPRIDGGTADAAVDAAPPDGAPEPISTEDFCDQYQAVCGFAGGPNRYNNYEQCVAAYDSYPQPQKVCVASELEMAEEAEGQELEARCQGASGKSPCDLDG